MYVVLLNIFKNECQVVFAASSCACFCLFVLEGCQFMFGPDRHCTLSLDPVHVVFPDLFSICLFTVSNLSSTLFNAETTYVHDYYLNKTCIWWYALKQLHEQQFNTRSFKNNDYVCECYYFEVTYSASF